MSAAGDNPAEFTLYSRQGCHLCEVMIEELLPLLRGRAELTVRDVDEQDSWRERYGLRVPVLERDGRTVCEFTLDRAALRQSLDAPG